MDKATPTPSPAIAAIMHNVRELRVQTAMHTGESTGNLDVLERRIEDGIRVLAGLHAVQPELPEVERLAAQAASAPAVRMLTEDEAEKCYSLDEETFFDLDELIDMLDEEQAKPGFLVYEGESVRHAASHYARGAVADLFERMGEQAFDDAGEHIGDWPDHAVKDDNSAELEKLIYDWLDANVKVHFYTVKNVRQIALTADMLGDDNASRTIPPSGVIGDAA